MSADLMSRYDVKIVAAPATAEDPAAEADPEKDTGTETDE